MMTLRKRAIVEVDDAAPGDIVDIDIQRVAVIDMGVEHGGDQVVRGADGVDIASQMQS